MNIGVIGSGAGWTFKTFCDIINKSEEKANFYIVTDRDGTFRDISDEYARETLKLESKDNEYISKSAMNFFKNQEKPVDYVMLNYSRLVTKSLYNEIATLNIHPALLPSYKGFKAINQAINNKARFVGTTLHLVDETVDAGQYIGQSISPIPLEIEENKIFEIAFIQKVYLSLLSYELFKTKSISVFPKEHKVTFNKKIVASKSCNPLLENQKFIDNLKLLENSRGFEEVLDYAPVSF